jgi:diaminohydroxyphosphoribosylaminopyrimidine deaminase/5-amino-6-(5-phosphoribosylamino)uracil reductase
MQKRDDKYYMRKALELARKGEGYTSPNPLVGAIVVKDGTIIGQGYHQYAGGLHAEVYALDEAGEKAEGATIYVNLEPCSHYGKTPPCSLRVIESGIDRAVIGMKDPNPKVSGSGIEQLKKKGIKVKIGVLEEEAKQLNEVFIKYICSNHPFIYSKTAQTLDGFIATKTGNSKWITNDQARRRGHMLRHRVDAILVGSGTVLSDDPKLTTRLTYEDGSDSTRIVLDTKLRVPLDAKVFDPNLDTKTLVITDKKIDKEKLRSYSDKENIEIIALPLDNNNRITLTDLLPILHQREIASILIEGGGTINHSFLQAGLVDKVYTFIAPRILGGNDGISAYNGKGPSTMKGVQELHDIKYDILGDNILVTGYY